jgi:PAS domain S-box-containing protein
MLAGLVLLEALSIVLFGTLLTRQQTNEVYGRAQHRLVHQATSMALQAREALGQERPAWVGLSVRIMGEAPSVAFAKITDPSGNVLYVSEGEPENVLLDTVERAQIAKIKTKEAMVFRFGKGRWEGVCPIYTGQQLRGFAWVETDRNWDQEELHSILRSTAIFGIIWIAASAILVSFLAHSISRPLAVLLRGTRSLMESPEGGGFPLPVSGHNEIGSLIEAFNRMAASVEEQRSGLNDTLSLLDSMLANAPIGLAFFDRRCRLVRVNQVFADMTGALLSRHLGRTLPEILPQPAAQALENIVLRVFQDEEPERNIELSGQQRDANPAWTWLVSAYPVRTTPQVRWAGVIVIDASERKRSEEALRRSEKLAVTGRLAASIAHEINNPLEAITNAFYLLHNHPSLDEEARYYASLAEQELQRASHITRQTLSFYRDSKQPISVSLQDLLDNVIELQHRSISLNRIDLQRRYTCSGAVRGFPGELRQVFLNLISNAIQAMPDGGTLRLRVTDAVDPETQRRGIAVSVIDTGSGIRPEDAKHLFQPFFTTKSAKGTGLGLWISKGIVQKYEGRIRFRSIRRGSRCCTCFRVFLPVSREVSSTDSPRDQDVPATISARAIA